MPVRQFSLSFLLTYLTILPLTTLHLKYYISGNISPIIKLLSINAIQFIKQTNNENINTMPPAYRQFIIPEEKRTICATLCETDYHNYVRKGDSISPLQYSMLKNILIAYLSSIIIFHTCVYRSIFFGLSSKGTVLRGCVCVYRSPRFADYSIRIPEDFFFIL